jgi:hypothetical protein
MPVFQKKIVNTSLILLIVTQVPVFAFGKFSWLNFRAKPTPTKDLIKLQTKAHWRLLKKAKNNGLPTTERSDGATAILTADQNMPRLQSHISIYLPESGDDVISLTTKQMTFPNPQNGAYLKAKNISLTRDNTLMIRRADADHVISEEITHIDGPEGQAFTKLLEREHKFLEPIGKTYPTTHVKINSKGDIEFSLSETPVGTKVSEEKIRTTITNPVAPLKNSEITPIDVYEYPHKLRLGILCTNGKVYYYKWNGATKTFDYEGKNSKTNTGYLSLPSALKDYKTTIRYYSDKGSTTLNGQSTDGIGELNTKMPASKKNPDSQPSLLPANAL